MLWKTTWEMQVKMAAGRGARETYERRLPVVTMLMFLVPLHGRLRDCTSMAPMVAHPEAHHALMRGWQ
jgi:hypothetical protein